MKRYLHNKFLPLAVLVMIAGLSGIYLSGTHLIHHQDLFDTNNGLRMATQRILNGLLEAETGQRGYILTGDNTYLEPYAAGGVIISNSLALYARHHLDEDQQSFLNEVKPLITKKLEELDRTVTLRREKGFEAARAVVVTNEGKALMDQLRRLFTMEHERAAAEREVLKDRINMLTQGTLYSLFVAIIGFLLTRYAMLRAT